MSQTPPSRPKKSIWLRMRPYVIMTVIILGIQFVIAYWLDWSLFHETEIELSKLDDGKKCMSFTVVNLLQEERVMEQPTLSLLAFNKDSVVRTRPIPLKLEGTNDDRILLQPGDSQRLCAGFESDMLKRNIIYKMQTFDEPKKTRCKFSVIVRKPSATHAHVYARAFNCADRLTTLYE